MKMMQVNVNDLFLLSQHKSEKNNEVLNIKKYILYIASLIKMILFLSIIQQMYKFA